MAVLALNDIWMLRVGCFTSDQAAINTFHYVVSDVTGAFTDDMMAEAFDEELSSLYKAVLSDNASYKGCSAQRVWPLPKTRAAPRTDDSGPGAVVGEMLPQQISGIISAQTELAGRNQRARVYIPFPSEVDNEDGAFPVDSYVTRLNNLKNAVYLQRVLTDAVSGFTAQVDPIVFHRNDNTFNRITNAFGKKLWANQRRRGHFGQRDRLPF